MLETICLQENYTLRNQLLGQSNKWGLSLRYNPVGSAFDVAGCSIFASKTLLKYLLALCNSNIMQSLIRVLSQTLNYEVGTIKAMPVVLSQAYEK